MIIKNYEMNKINLDENKIILFYGKNEGLKNESFNFISKNINNVSNYEEKEILEKPDTFIESILSKSLFDDKKIIVIKRATDRILKILDEIKLKNLEDIIVIISENLDKKSKLRSHFEKSKKNVCIAFYPDNEQTLSRLCVSFFQEKKIPISQSNINLIVNKCGGDREVLFNELTKIELYYKQGKKINAENISKLINLSEDYSLLISISIMVFYVYAAQCMSTFAIVKKETNTWKWAIVMIIYMTLLAYIGSTLVFQIGSSMGYT